jgi:uncharacterized membrane protein
MEKFISTILDLLKDRKDKDNITDDEFEEIVKKALF